MQECRDRRAAEAKRWEPFQWVVGQMKTGFQEMKQMFASTHKESMEKMTEIQDAVESVSVCPIFHAVVVLVIVLVSISV